MWLTISGDCFPELTKYLVAESGLGHLKAALKRSGGGGGPLNSAFGCSFLAFGSRIENFCNACEDKKELSEPREKQRRGVRGWEKEVAQVFAEWGGEGEEVNTQVDLLSD